MIKKQNMIMGQFNDFLIKQNKKNIDQTTSFTKLLDLGNHLTVDLIIYLQNDLRIE